MFFNVLLAVPSVRCPFRVMLQDDRTNGITSREIPEYCAEHVATQPETGTSRWKPGVKTLGGLQETARDNSALELVAELFLIPFFARPDQDCQATPCAEKMWPGASRTEVGACRGNSDRQTGPLVQGGVILQVGLLHCLIWK